MRLSQCMIVKNEEKNIERALTWGKGIVSEQIVVDTGSVDRTAEIAEKMGAKVFRFEWVDDFAAAKNFALDKASGDWIAFLDADEYMGREEAKKLIGVLGNIEKYNRGKKQEEQIVVVSSDMINIDQNGNVGSITQQSRFFKNVSFLRYHGKIHEQIRHVEGKRIGLTNMGEELRIFHTGYAGDAAASKTKAERNIRMLKRELEEKPDSARMQLYLAESLRLGGDYEQALSYEEQAVGNRDGSLNEKRLAEAYQLLLYDFQSRYGGKSELAQKMENFYEQAVRADGKRPDYDVAMMLWNLAAGEYPGVIDCGSRALTKAAQMSEMAGSNIGSMLWQVYAAMATAYERLGDVQQMFYHGTLSLKAQPFNENLLGAMLRLLVERERETPENILKFLMQLYNPQEPRDALFLLKVSRNNGMRELETLIMENIPPEIRAQILS